MQEEENVEFIHGPYFLHLRKEWLEHLLNMEKEINQQGRDVSLITEAELHEIRHQWRNDPLTPDWSDDLPKIYKRVYPNGNIEFLEDDGNAFSNIESEMIEHLSKTHEVDSELIKKLIDIELSLSGLGKRQGIFNRLDKVLRQDWGNLEIAKQKRESEKTLQYALLQDINEIQAELNGIDSLLNSEL